MVLLFQCPNIADDLDGYIAANYSAAHDHPALFPLALARDHITSWTNPGDLALDPMAGSGTTLRAARDAGRHSIGIETHELYYLDSSACAPSGAYVKMHEASLARSWIN